MLVLFDYELVGNEKNHPQWSTLLPRLREQEHRSWLLSKSNQPEYQGFDGVTLTDKIGRYSYSNKIFAQVLQETNTPYHDALFVSHELERTFGASIFGIQSFHYDLESLNNTNPCYNSTYQKLFEALKQNR